MKRAALAITLLLLALPLLAQTPAPAPAQSPFKNVQYLKSLTPAQLSATMQMMSASLGTNCGFCHVRKGEELDFPADDKHEKETARHMIAMTEELNAKYFDNHPVVSCNSCHRGLEHPVNIVALPRAPQSAEAEAEEHAHATAGSRPAVPTRDEIVAKYAAALGKADAAALSSLSMKGTREGNGQAAPLEIVQSHGSMRSQSGEMITVITPSGGWMSDKGQTRALPPPQLERGTEMMNATQFVLPQDIPANARVSGRKDKVGDREAYVVNATVKPGVRQRLYFDAANGELLRRITYTATPIGEIPMQTDYSDYREEGGVKLPHTVRVESVDPRASSTRHYTEIRTGAKVDESVFVKP